MAKTGRTVGGGGIVMSVKERRRLEVLSRVKSKQITLREGGGLMGLSYRQSVRVYRRYSRQGGRGLAHGLRGKASNRKRDEAAREAVLRLYRAKYHDFGPTLACEYLARDGYEVARETLRRWLGEEGLWV